MRIDQFNRLFLTKEELFDYLYESDAAEIDQILLDDSDEINRYNKTRSKNGDQMPSLCIPESLDISIEEFDKINQQAWFMPKNYCPNLIEQIYTQCKTDEEKTRVVKELQLFGKHNMIDLLFYLKYLVDTMRDHNIVWGVGRGSSVASYVLYLIGVHKIDSIKYDLDIHEFLK